MLAKLKNLLEKDGFSQSVRKLARYALWEGEARLAPSQKEGEALLAELRRGDYERVVLRRGSFGWHTPLFQRAQQLSRAMARRGCFVLYEAAAPHDRVRGARKLGEGLWLVNLRSPRLRARIEGEIEAGARPRYVMLGSPEARLSADVLRDYEARGWSLLYDYIDALSAEISAAGRVPKGCRALYEYAMRSRGTLVLASSRALLRDAARRKERAGALLLENGVDCAHFQQIGPCPEDPAFQALLDGGRPIVGYYGALASWLDYGALRAIAADGRFTLLLIGVKYDGSFDAAMAGCENLCFLGRRPYETLRDYAARCDVLLIPFRPGAVGDAASPVKLFEYMALGKPVVAGNVEECRRYESVLIARGPEDYPRRVEEALTLGESRVYRLRELREAASADWLRRAEKLREELRRREREKVERASGI